MIGRHVLHYRILAELGQGGMGLVYRARDERLGREVALKMLPAELARDVDFQARFMREARAVSALNHPGIVTLHDLQNFEGHTFLVMELVEGESFSKLAQTGLAWKRAVELVAGAAEALAAAHARGILHRDVKSDNLMVTQTGQPKVLDFGLAKLRDLNAPAGPDAETGITANMRKQRELSVNSFGLAATVRPVGGGSGGAGVTQVGQMMGTPAYMAPECFEGKADARSEVYALGVVLYELLTGKRPFDRHSEMAMMSAILLDDPEPPSRAVPDRGIPPEVDALVARALAKQPDDRFADVASFAAALRELVRERPSLVTIPVPAPVPAATPTARWPLVAIGLGVLGLAGVGAWLALRGGGTASEKSPTMEVTSSRRLTLEPGCDEYPRQHPDGKRVVFDGIIGGDYEIMVLDLDTNERKRLTTTPGWDYASALSPDGALVAFVHEDLGGRTVRIVPLDGSAPPREVGAIVGYPAWSRDGGLLVGDTSGHVVRRDLATGRDTVLGSLPAGARLYHLVEVRGAGIAVMWWTSSDADATSLGELDTSGHLRVIEEFATDYEGGLAASSQRRGYYATRKGATEGNQLLFRAWGGTKPIAIPGVSPGAGIDVRPDGKRLVFSTCVEREYIARIVPGQEPTVVSRGAWQDTNPSVVDANRIVITSNRLGPQHGWLVDLTGGAQPQSITPPGALGSSASPDGTLVVFATRTGLGVRALAGGEHRMLTSDPSDAAPAFTRDSKQVVFERTVKGATYVFVVDAAGGTPRPLEVGESPAPSPSDDSVVFLTSPDAGGTRRVMLGSLTGASPRELSALGPATWQRPRFSPDGTQLLLVRGYQQLVTAPLDGSAPPTIVWNTTAGSINSAAWLRDGSGFVAGVGGYDGDLWLAEGTFP